MIIHSALASPSPLSRYVPHTNWLLPEISKCSFYTESVCFRTSLTLVKRYRSRKMKKLKNAKMSYLAPKRAILPKEGRFCPKKGLFCPKNGPKKTFVAQKAACPKTAVSTPFSLYFCNPAGPRQLLLRLLTRIRITQMRVKVLVQNLGRLLREIPSFSPSIQKSWPQNHNRLARTLFQLNLYMREPVSNDLQHVVYFLFGYGPGSRLFFQQILNVFWEFGASVRVLFDFLVVDVSDWI